MKRVKAVILSVAVLVALSGFAVARDHDNDRNDHRNGYQAGYDQGYRVGMRDGQNDRGHNRRDIDHVNDTDGYSKGMGSQGQYKKGYREGYRKGYEEAYRRDRDHDNDQGRNWHRHHDGNWNNGGQNNNDVAYRTGYQDGMTVGQQDKAGGHSYRPHDHDQSYGNADHNYSQVGGDKNAYKQRYRQGFDAGYARGYNGR